MKNKLRIWLFNISKWWNKLNWIEDVLFKLLDKYWWRMDEYWYTNRCVDGCICVVNRLSTLFIFSFSFNTPFFNLDPPDSFVFISTFHKILYALQSEQNESETSVFCVLFKSNQIGTTARDVYRNVWHCTHSKNERFKIKSALSSPSPPVAAAAAIYWYSITIIHCVCEFTKRKIMGFLFHSFNFPKNYMPLYRSRLQKEYAPQPLLHQCMQFVKNNIKCSRCFTFNAH